MELAGVLSEPMETVLRKMLAGKIMGTSPSKHLPQYSFHWLTILQQVPSSHSAFTRLIQDGVCLSAMLYPLWMLYVSDAGVSFCMTLSILPIFPFTNLM